MPKGKDRLGEALHFFAMLRLPRELSPWQRTVPCDLSVARGSGQPGRGQPLPEDREAHVLEVVAMLDLRRLTRSLIGATALVPWEPCGQFFQFFFPPRWGGCDWLLDIRG